MTIRDVIQRWSVGFAVLLIAGGIGLKWGLFPMLLHTMIEDQLRLSPGNEETWDTWTSPSDQLPIYMKFTFLNVTNPEEIKNGEKPFVEEVGPFVYLENRKKVGVSTMEDTITYGSWISYEFQEDLSCDICKKDTEITVINPALAGILAMFETLEFTSLDKNTIQLIEQFGGLEALKTLVLQTINENVFDEVNHPEYFDDLFTTETANKLIFEGYEPGVLKFILFFLDYLGFSNVIEIPDIIADGKFAFFKGNNGTADNGWYKINSGIYDMSQYQRIIEYNGNDKLPSSWWNTFPSTPSQQRSGVEGRCLDIAGTDGTQYPPFLSKENDLWLFSSDLCRSIYLSYYEEVDMDGVTTYQFRVKPEVLSFSNPDNACFCPEIETCAVESEDGESWDLSGCTNCRDGMLNLMGCQGAPVIISLPHFLNADDEIQSLIGGLSPSEELHTTFLNMEPMTGVALEAHKRIQVNVPLKRNENIDVLKNVQEAVFPVVWVDEGAILEGDNMKDLKSKLVSPFIGVDVGAGFMIGIGCLILIGLSVLSVCRRNRTPNTYVMKK